MQFRSPNIPARAAGLQADPLSRQLSIMIADKANAADFADRLAAYRKFVPDDPAVALDMINAGNAYKKYDRVLDGLLSLEKWTGPDAHVEATRAMALGNLGRKDEAHAAAEFLASDPGKAWLAKHPEPAAPPAPAP